MGWTNLHGVVKKIKGAVDKNDDLEGTCEQGLRVHSYSGESESDIAPDGFIENPTNVHIQQWQGSKINIRVLSV